jgi:hypothetical protein
MADAFFSSLWRILDPYGCAEPDYLVGRSKLCLDKQMFVRYWSVTYGTVGLMKPISVLFARCRPAGGIESRDQSFTINVYDEHIRQGGVRCQHWRGRGTTTATFVPPC